MAPAGRIAKAEPFHPVTAFPAPCRGSGENAAAEGLDRRLAAGVDVKFFIDMTHMVRNGIYGYSQQRGAGFIVFAIDEHLQNAQFMRREMEANGGVRRHMFGKTPARVLPLRETVR